MAALVPDHPGHDPFGEHASAPFTRTCDVLGGRFVFASTSDALLALVDRAYASLPVAPATGEVPRFEITLRLVAARRTPYPDAPPPLATHAGAGVLYGVIDADNHVVIAPASGRASITVSVDMLAHAYHVRYELIEFAVFILAARSMGRVPLHAASVGLRGRSVLLLGPSGAGKSTLALRALENGMALLAEDAVFVDPRTGGVSGVGNYVHLKRDSVELLAQPSTRQWIRAAPVIHRRSGVAKYEADLRVGPFAATASHWQLAAVVFVTATPPARGAPLLQRLEEAVAVSQLVADQPYAARQPGWHDFVSLAGSVGTYRLHRGRDTDAAVEALCRLLSGAPHGTATSFASA